MSDDRKVAVIGVPTSAGADAPGQEKAPAALRDAGAARKACRVDRSRRPRDLPLAPRPHNPCAQNLGKVVEIVEDTARRVVEAAQAEELTLVLGGDCTVGIGTVAGHLETSPAASASSTSTCTPTSTSLARPPRRARLDGDGAHARRGGRRATLVDAGPKTPMLDPRRSSSSAGAPTRRTARERGDRALEPRQGSPATKSERPAGAAGRALERYSGSTGYWSTSTSTWSTSPTPRSLRTPAATRDPLRAGGGRPAVLLASPALAGLTVTELNPDHVEDGAGSIERLASDLARSLA